MNLHTLKPRPGSKHRVKRLGCGESSGHGKTSGKGHKGQKARSGGSIRLGFEGGQMPLIRRMPKRGFNNAQFKTRFAVVNLDALNEFENGATVDEQSLLAAGVIRRPYDLVKILGSGELKKKLTIVANKASETAKAAIEKAGGSLTLK
jgi:large subunit ribosomal protein L15